MGDPDRGCISAQVEYPTKGVQLLKPQCGNKSPGGLKCRFSSSSGSGVEPEGPYLLQGPTSCQYCSRAGTSSGKRVECVALIFSQRARESSGAAEQISAHCPTFPA